MLKGIYLSLMIGPVIPIPAPQIVIDSLSRIQVTNSKDRSGFQITFAVGKTSSLLTTMLAAGYLDPISTRVMIVVTLNGIQNVIIDGMVTNQEYTPSNEAGKSALTITGEDISLAMDLVTKILPYPGMPDVAKINLILATYSFLGIIPLVIPPVNSLVKVPAHGWDSQISTDKEYIKGLAQNCGYVFFIIPGPLPGQNIAYFGPDVNLPVPQSALSINLDIGSNAESMSFSLDGMAKKIKIFTVMDPFTHKIPIPIPVPNINVFKPPLGLRPTPPAKVEFAKDAAKLDPENAAQNILGFLINNTNAVSATGTLDVIQYKKILRSRMLVGVRGAGIVYDGLYYVDSVTHNIKPGEYKQNFTLSRDGLISNTPLLVP